MVTLQGWSFSCLWGFLASKTWILSNSAKSQRSYRGGSRQPVSKRFLQNTSCPTLGLQEDNRDSVSALFVLTVKALTSTAETHTHTMPSLPGTGRQLLVYSVLKDWPGSHELILPSSRCMHRNSIIH